MVKKIEEPNVIPDLTPITSQNLRKLGEFGGMNQAAMARATGIANPTMGNYLHGKRVPGVNYLAHICTLDIFKDMGLHLTVDMLLSADFDPAKAVRANETPAEQIELVEDHGDLTGTYLLYYFDQTKEMLNGDMEADRDFRYGVITVYEDVSEARPRIGVFATFYEEDELDKAMRVKKDVDKLFGTKSGKDLNGALKNYYSSDREGSGVYNGELSVGKRHMFIVLWGSIYHDRAMMIFYSPDKREDGDYIGGLGSVTSVSHGDQHMPSGQNVVLSKYELDCPSEEIAEHLQLSHVKVEQSAEAVALARLAQKLYSHEDSMNELLEDDDKYALIENRLNHMVKRYVEKNACSVRCISREADKAVYQLIMKCKK